MVNPRHSKCQKGDELLTTDLADYAKIFFSSSDNIDYFKGIYAHHIYILYAFIYMIFMRQIILSYPLVCDYLTPVFEDIYDYTIMIFHSSVEVSIQ